MMLVTIGCLTKTHFTSILQLRLLKKYYLPHALLLLELSLINNPAVIALKYRILC